MSHVTRPRPYDEDRSVPRAIPSQTATRSESAVIIDLLGRGFDVFRSCGDHGIVDLIALHRERAGRPLAVEVKTGVVPERGNPERIYLRPLRDSQRWVADLVAIVDPRDLLVVYISPTANPAAKNEEVPLVDPYSLLWDFVSGSDEDAGSEASEWVEVVNATG